MLLDNKNILKSVTVFSTSIRYTEGDVFIYNEDSNDNGKIYRVNELNPQYQFGVDNFGDNVYTSITPDEDKEKNPGYPIYTVYAEPATETIAGIPYFTESISFGSNGMEFLKLLSSNDCSLVTVPGSIANYLCASSPEFDNQTKYVMLSRHHGAQVIAISLSGDTALISGGTHDYSIGDATANMANFSDSETHRMSSENSVINNSDFHGLIQYEVTHEDDDSNDPHQISNDDNTCVVRVSNQSISDVDVIKVVVQYDFNNGHPSYQEFVPIYIKDQLGTVATDGMFCKLDYHYVSTNEFTITATKVEDTGGNIPNMRNIKIQTIIGLKRIRNE